ncbi:uncharacterized protein LOC128865989 [Anastrepha ludens]|uniref:uncharacterized protein LOC128865989 n=1 Tax=Anastrepha ludens TaxID=28586 RepID=UPI0023AFDDF5|nr:uncharacterized protein LOC128865989 [Anastrepha ludens]
MKSKRYKSEPQAEDASRTLLAFENGDNEAAEFNESAENCELQSPQAQTRWTPECTRVMLQLRFERQLEFQQRIRQKKELWSEIATEMRRQGLCDFSLTAEVCDLKYRNMLQTYKKNRIKEDSGMQSLIAWEYYELFKDALTAVDELDAAQEGQERVVPSLLCESVCEAGNEDETWPAANELDCNQTTVELSLNAPQESLEIEAEEVKSVTNIKPAAVSSRKRSRRCAMKNESVSPPPVGQITLSVPTAEEATITENSKQESFSHAPLNETPLQLLNPRSCNSARPQRKRACPSFIATIPHTVTIEAGSVGIDAQNESTLTAIPNEPIISSTSAATIPIPAIMQAPTIQPQPPQIAAPLSQTPVTIVHPNHLQAIPTGLAPSEMRECQVFGESIGLQLAHVREPHVRAMLQFKIQELLYLAKTGKLLETVRV